MFHPVGPRPATIYWRRRLLVIGLVVLTGLTLWVACSSGSGRPAAETTRSSAASAASSVAARSGPTPAAPAAGQPTVAASLCTAGNLKVSAVASAPGYHVGDQPSLSLQVINSGTAPCVADLADRQIELRVYNGESRVWGSHDCQIEPGTSPATLPVGTAVRRSIVWTGLSSQPQCAGQRVRVGPGTYTLHALLAGQEGATSQFTIS